MKLEFMKCSALVFVTIVSLAALTFVAPSQERPVSSKNDLNNKKTTQKADVPSTQQQVPKEQPINRDTTANDQATSGEYSPIQRQLMQGGEQFVLTDEHDDIPEELINGDQTSLTRRVKETLPDGREIEYEITDELIDDDEESEASNDEEIADNPNKIIEKPAESNPSNGRKPKPHAAKSRPTKKQPDQSTDDVVNNDEDDEHVEEITRNKLGANASAKVPQNAPAPATPAEKEATGPENTQASDKNEPSNAVAPNQEKTIPQTVDGAPNRPNPKSKDNVNQQSIPATTGNDQQPQKPQDGKSGFMSYLPDIIGTGAKMLQNIPTPLSMFSGGEQPSKDKSENNLNRKQSVVKNSGNKEKSVIDGVGNNDVEIIKNIGNNKIRINHQEVNNDIDISTKQQPKMPNHTISQKEVIPANEQSENDQEDEMDEHENDEHTQHEQIEDPQLESSTKDLNEPNNRQKQKDLSQKESKRKLSPKKANKKLKKQQQEQNKQKSEPSNLTNVDGSGNKSKRVINNVRKKNVQHTQQPQGDITNIVNSGNEQDELINNEEEDNLQHEHPAHELNNLNNRPNDQQPASMPNKKDDTQEPPLHGNEVPSGNRMPDQAEETNQSIKPDGQNNQAQPQSDEQNHPAQEPQQIDRSIPQNLKQTPASPTQQANPNDAGLIHNNDQPNNQHSSLSSQPQSSPTSEVIPESQPISNQLQPSDPSPQKPSLVPATGETQPSNEHILSQDQIHPQSQNGEHPPGEHPNEKQLPTTPSSQQQLAPVSMLTKNKAHHEVETPGQTVYVNGGQQYPVNVNQQTQPSLSEVPQMSNHGTISTTETTSTSPHGDGNTIVETTETIIEGDDDEGDEEEEGEEGEEGTETVEYEESTEDSNANQGGRRGRWRRRRRRRGGRRRGRWGR